MLLLSFLDSRPYDLSAPMPLIDPNHSVFQSPSSAPLNTPTVSEVELHFAQASFFIRTGEQQKFTALLDSLDYIPFSRASQVQIQGTPFLEALPHVLSDAQLSSSSDQKSYRARQAFEYRMGSLLTCALVEQNYPAMLALVQKHLQIIAKNHQRHQHMQVQKFEFFQEQQQKAGKQISIPYDWQVDPKTLTEEYLQEQTRRSQVNFLFQSLPSSYDKPSDLFFKLDQVHADAGIFKQIFALDDPKALAHLMADSITSDLLSFALSDRVRSNHSMLLQACAAKATKCVCLLLENTAFYDQEMNGGIYFHAGATHSPFSLLLAAAPDPLLLKDVKTPDYPQRKALFDLYSQRMQQFLQAAPLEWNPANLPPEHPRVKNLTYHQKTHTGSWVGTLLGSTLPYPLIQSFVLTLASKGHALNAGSLSYEGEHCVKQGLLEQAQALKEAHELRSVLPQHTPSSAPRRHL